MEKKTKNNCSEIDIMKKNLAEVERIQKEKNVGFAGASFIYTAKVGLTSLRSTLREGLYWAEQDKDEHCLSETKRLIDVVDEKLAHIDDKVLDDDDIEVLLTSIGFAYAYADGIALRSFYNDCEAAKEAGLSVEEYYEKNSQLAPEHIEKLKEIYGEDE